MKERVYIEEAGCNRRKLDLERIRAYLEINGYILVNSPEKADRIIVATCAFKRKEEERSVARLKALQKYADKTVVFGCLPDISPERFSRLGDLPKVAPKELEKIGALFSGSQQPFDEVSDSHLLPRGRLRTSALHEHLALLKAGSSFDVRDLVHQASITFGQHMRTIFNQSPALYYLLVCRGCQGRCSYCGIRRAIGSVKSKPVAAVADDMRVGLREGFRNFVILGDDPGCYGLDIGNSLPELVAVLTAVANEFSAKRPEMAGSGDALGLHLSEVHPKFLIHHADALFHSAESMKIKSLLCPIQSGSDRILALMDREHTIGELGNILKKIREESPGMGLTTQIIVGFPGESETDFLQTLNAVREVAFDSVVIFPYDDKEGTDASRLPDKVPSRVIKQRMRQSFRYFRKAGIPAYYSCPP